MDKDKGSIRGEGYYRVITRLLQVTYYYYLYKLVGQSPEGESTRDTSASSDSSKTTFRGNLPEKWRATRTKKGGGWACDR